MYVSHTWLQGTTVWNLTLGQKRRKEKRKKERHHSCPRRWWKTEERGDTKLTAVAHVSWQGQKNWQADRTRGTLTGYPVSYLNVLFLICLLGRGAEGKPLTVWCLASNCLYQVGATSQYPFLPHTPVSPHNTFFSAAFITPPPHALLNQSVDGYKYKSGLLTSSKPSRDLSAMMSWKAKCHELLS